MSDEPTSSCQGQEEAAGEPKAPIAVEDRPPTPPRAAMASGKHNNMPPPATKPGVSNSRKRSRGEMSADEKPEELPQPTDGQQDQSVSKEKGGEKATPTEASSTAIPDSQPQERPQNTHLKSSSTVTQQTQTPPSAQQQKAGSKTTAQTKGAAKHAATNLSKQTSEEDTEDESTSSDGPDFDQPDHPIADFDWSDLQQRFHYKVQELEAKEDVLLREFNELIESFHVWADVGNRKEVDRGFKRLKTRIAFAQNREDELEEKRQHYIKVVEAFTTVGSLLNAPNWAEDFIFPKSLARRYSDNKHHHAKRPRSDRSNDSGMQNSDDVDARRYSDYDLHASRCVVS